MPTYEYECAAGHTFEVFQKMSDPPIKHCLVEHVNLPETGVLLCRAGCKRLISAPGFILKGGGWFADGYSSAPSGKKKG